MSILSEIIGGVLSPITNTVTAIFTKKEDVSLEKFRIDGQVDTALVQAHVAIAQAQATLLANKWAVFLQATFSIPLSVYYGKCLIWDKVLRLGSTDALQGDISTYSMWIIGFLFLHSGITAWSRKT